MRTISKTTTTSYIPLAVHKDFLIYNDEFVAIRSRMKRKMKQCFRCHRKFQAAGQGEPVSLVVFKRHGNRLVCNDCANWILGDEQEGFGHE